MAGTTLGDVMTDMNMEKPVASFESVEAKPGIEAIERGIETKQLGEDVKLAGDAQEAEGVGFGSKRLEGLQKLNPGTAVRQEDLDDLTNGLTELNRQIVQARADLEEERVTILGLSAAPADTTAVGEAYHTTNKAKPEGDAVEENQGPKKKAEVEQQTPEELKEERRIKIIKELEKEWEKTHGPMERPMTETEIEETRKWEERYGLPVSGRTTTMTDAASEVFFDHNGKGKNSIPSRADIILAERFPEYAQPEEQSPSPANITHPPEAVAPAPEARIEPGVGMASEQVSEEMQEWLSGNERAILKEEYNDTERQTATNVREAMYEQANIATAQSAEGQPNIVEALTAAESSHDDMEALKLVLRVALKVGAEVAKAVAINIAKDPKTPPELRIAMGIFADLTTKGSKVFEQLASGEEKPDLQKDVSNYIKSKFSQQDET